MKKKQSLVPFLGVMGAGLVAGMTHLSKAASYCISPVATAPAASEVWCGTNGHAHSAINGSNALQVLAYCGNGLVQNACGSAPVIATGCNASGSVCVMTGYSSGESVGSANASETLTKSYAEIRTPGDCACFQ